MYACISTHTCICVYACVVYIPFSGQRTAGSLRGSVSSLGCRMMPKFLESAQAGRRKTGFHRHGGTPRAGWFRENPIYKWNWGYIYEKPQVVLKPSSFWLAGTWLSKLQKRTGHLEGEGKSTSQRWDPSQNRKGRKLPQCLTHVLYMFLLIMRRDFGGAFFEIVYAPFNALFW